jgi:PAS domain S-box-containing protein
VKTIEPSESRGGLAFLLMFVRLAVGIITAAIGLLALLGWVLGLPLLASFGADLMPMAPSTAVLFLVFGVAIGLHARTPLSRRTFWISVAAGYLGATVALVLFVLSCLNVHWAVEHLGLNISGTVRGTPVGHMSPVAAFCFLLASVSFLASLSQSVIRRWRVVLALGFASVLLEICFVFVLVYLFGTPLLYGGTFIPPALNTVLAFTMLGLALLVSAVRPSGPQGRQPNDIPATLYGFLLIFALLAMGIVTVGYLYYRHYEELYRAEVEQQLSAIAELKVGELTQWRKERLGDGGTLFKNAAFSDLVRRFFENPPDADAQRQIQAWLEKSQTMNQYDEIRLLDVQGVTHMTVPASRTDMASVVSRRIPEVLRAGQVVFQDFYRNEHDQRVYLAVMVPILDERDGSAPLGVLVLDVNPETYLYPFIKRWPTPSLSAETLLVRKEGNEVVFLNELRFQTNTALNFRAPLDRVALPAAQAALGREGITEGMDYQGLPVVAALRVIPDSPWSLVARMNTAEVYAPLRARLWQMVVIIGVLLFGAGACVAVVWWRRRARFFREQNESAEALRTSELRYRRLFESAKDGILILDAETGRVADVNAFLVELLGYSHEAFLGKKVWELGLLKDIVANQNNFTELQQTGYVRYEDMALETRDGRRIDVEFVSNVYLVNHQKVIQCNIRDITARKRVEEQLTASFKEVHDLKAALDEHAIVATTDAQGKITYVNDKFCTISKYSHEELLGQDHRIINSGHHPKEFFHNLWTTIAQGRVWHGEIKNKAKDGSFYWVDATIVPFLDEQGKPRQYVAIRTDITARKQAEEEVRELNTQLEQRVAARTAELAAANKELEAFCYSVSHDLRAPLRGLDGFSLALLEDYGAKLGDEGKSLLQRIRAGSQRMGQLIDDLLNLSRVSRSELHRGPVDLSGLANDVVDELRERDPHRDVALRIAENLTADGDSQLLRVVLENLLGNAWKYTAKRPQAAIEFGRGCDNGHSSFFVRDDGVGFDMQYVDKLFTPFQRLHRMNEFPGSGIGLATVQRIIHRHGGRVWAQAEVNKGATFHFTLS